MSVRPLARETDILCDTIFNQLCCAKIFLRGGGGGGGGSTRSDTYEVERPQDLGRGFQIVDI